MLRSVLAVFALALVSAASSAAVIYEPVQTQYRDPRYDRPMVYYGGNRAVVRQYIRNLQLRYNTAFNAQTDLGVSLAREGRFGYNLVHPGLTTEIPYVFTDALPAGVNGFPYGFNENDAHNEAMSNLPLYFRMSDLRGHVEADGTVVVPAMQPHGLVEIRPVRPASTQPAAQASPQPILIIPKRLLQKKLNAQGDPVARAQ